MKLEIHKQVNNQCSSRPRINFQLLIYLDHFRDWGLMHSFGKRLKIYKLQFCKKGELV